MDSWLQLQFLFSRCAYELAFGPYQEASREVKKELKKLQMKPEAGEYAEQDKIAKFYELGSRWAFLLHDQIDKGRFQKEWIKDENFTLAFHGLCNSLLLGHYEEVLIISRLSEE